MRNFTPERAAPDLPKAVTLETCDFPIVEGEVNGYKTLELPKELRRLFDEEGAHVVRINSIRVANGIPDYGGKGSGENYSLLPHQDHLDPEGDLRRFLMLSKRTDGARGSSTLLMTPAVAATVLPLEEAWIKDDVRRALLGTERNYDSRFRITKEQYDSCFDEMGGYEAVIAAVLGMQVTARRELAVRLGILGYLMRGSRADEVMREIVSAHHVNIYEEKWERGGVVIIDNLASSTRGKEEIILRCNATTAPSHFVRNAYGGSLGPVFFSIHPHTGKNKEKPSAIIQAMKNMSPFQVGVIVACVVLAGAGLYFFMTFTGFGKKEIPVGTVVIWGTLPQEAVDAGLVALMDADDRFSDLAYSEGSAGSFSQDLANAIASGRGPDLVIITQEQLLTERSKLAPIPYESIPERAFRDDYLSIFELYLSEEGTYGVPLVLDPLVLYYNRAILASHQIVNAPSTWEAVSGLALTITKRDDRGTISRSLIPLGEYVNVRNARSLVSLLLMQAGNPITMQTGVGVRTTLSADETEFGATAAQSAVNFYAQFADPAKTVYSWNRSLPESRAAFLAGDLALYPGLASERPFIAAANPNLDFDMAAMPQPGTSATRVTTGQAYALAVPKASPNLYGAYQAAFSITAPATAKIIADALAVAPARRDLLNPSASDRYSTVIYEEALTAKGWLSPAPYITDAIFSAMIGNVISGRMDIEEALTTADLSLDAALR